jgi:hypothetical protein
MKRLILFLSIVSCIIELEGQDTIPYEYKVELNKTQYNKNNILVSTTPYGGFILGSQNARFGISTGHSFKYGYFIANKVCLCIGSFQNYHYFTEVLEGVKEVSHTTTSTVSFTARYYVLNKRFTPFVDLGFENYFNYDDWEAWDGLKPKAYYVGSAYGAVGISVPISKFNLNVSYRYLYPVFKSNDAELYNRYSFSKGWHFEPGFTYIFNKNKKALKEKYSIE